MKKWVKAAAQGEFEDSDRKMVDLGGNLQIGLFKVDGAFHAISAWCSHQRATMIHGSLDGYELTCPFHGARFDVRNGRALSLPAVRPVKSYPVKVEGEDILLKV
jgi:nitrite reductase/ring-hydroxylating ferredoxin subunit